MSVDDENKLTRTKYSYYPSILIMILFLLVCGIVTGAFVENAQMKREMNDLSKAYIDEKRDELQQRLKENGLAEVKVKYDLQSDDIHGSREKIFSRVPGTARDYYTIYFESEWIDLLYLSGQQKGDYTRLRSYMMDIGNNAEYSERHESWDIDDRHMIFVSVQVMASDWDIGIDNKYFQVYGKTGQKFSMPYKHDLRSSCVYVDSKWLCESEIGEKIQAKREKLEEEEKNNSAESSNGSSQKATQSGSTARSGSSTTQRRSNSTSRSYSRSSKGDYYDSGDYDDADAFAEDWAEEFGDGDYDDGYDDAYDYWEENNGD